MTQDFAVTPGMCGCFLSSPRLERLASPMTWSCSLVLLPYGLLLNGRMGFPLGSSPFTEVNSGGSSLLERSTGTNNLL